MNHQFTKHLKNILETRYENFSHLINLVSLNINIPYSRKLLKVLDWNNVKHISLPALKILKAQGIPSNGLISLIESTKGILLKSVLIMDMMITKVSKQFIKIM